MIIADGIAPINGPKNGMTFVTPIMIDTSSAWGVPMSIVPAKQIKPMITESMIFPIKKPRNVRFTRSVLPRIYFACSSENIANRIFLACSEKPRRLSRQYADTIMPIKKLNIPLIIPNSC